MHLVSLLPFYGEPASAAWKATRLSAPVDFGAQILKEPAPPPCLPKFQIASGRALSPGYAAMHHEWAAARREQRSHVAAAGRTKVLATECIMFGSSLMLRYRAEMMPMRQRTPAVITTTRYYSLSEPCARRDGSPSPEGGQIRVLETAKIGCGAARSSQPTQVLPRRRRKAESLSCFLASS